MILANYNNGNTQVTLKDDGTKIREWEGVPKPEFPESVDLKITNKCDLGCAFCHECSTPFGEHAEVSTIVDIIKGLPPGVEIAIGGGNPLDHPQLEEILQLIRSKGLIANMTVNAKHIANHNILIKKLREMNLIKGLGISYTPGYSDDIVSVTDRNTVLHVIAGESSLKHVFNLSTFGVKILILGYKQYGRGRQYYSTKIKHNLDKYRYWIPTLLRRSLNVVSFDNLALEQLGIKNILKPEVWDKFYMGDDGKFTMYVDAVTKTYAKSSVNPRIPLNGKTIPEAFKSLTFDV